MTSRIVCPFCKEPAAIKESKYHKYEDGDYWKVVVYSYACPRGHLQSGWYEQPEIAFKAWVRLVKMTE